jgi:HK97 family phage major capsid protein
MKKTALQLREERKSVNDKIDSLMALETRTADQEVELNGHYDAVEKLSLSIDNAEREEKRQAAIASAAAGASASKSEEKELRNFSLGKLIEARLNNKPVDGLEKELIDESAKEARSNGFEVKGTYLGKNVLDAMAEKRMTAGSATGGGNTIQTDKVGFFDALYAKRVLDVLGVKMLSGLANNVDLTGLATGVVSSWGTEIEELASGSPTTASRPMTPHRLGSFIPMSNQLLIQNPQLEAFVIQSLMESIYVAVEAAYINGSGSAMTGLLGTANIQNVAIGAAGGAPSYAKILELVQTLGTANARVEDLKFLINPKVEAKLKQTAIDSGSGAMIMAYQNYFNGQPGVIDGKITAITSNVPSNLTKGSTTGVCSAIICGEFGKSAIGQFGGMDVIIDPYTLARTGQTRIVANTFWDCAFEQPAVFGAILDATTT